jgi:hypothetical protein
MAYSKLENGLKYTLMITLFCFFRSRMNKLVYIFVPNQFVIGDVVLKLLIKRLAVAMVNKTVEHILPVSSALSSLRIYKICR